MNLPRLATATLPFLLGMLSLWDGNDSLAQTKQPTIFDASLLTALKDPNPSVRQEAVRNLYAVRPITPEVVAAFNHALQDESEYVRGEAVRVISEIGAGEAVSVVSSLRQALKGTAPVLIKLLVNKAEVQHVHLYVPVALGRIKSASADTIAALVHVGKDTGDTLPIRERALSALGEIGPEASAAIPVLQKLASDDESELVRIKAWEALAQIQPDNREAIQVLVEVAQSKRGKSIKVTEDGSLASVVVSSALSTLVKIRAVKEVLPLLIEVMKGKPETGGFEAGFTAVTLLGELGSDAKPAIPALVEFLRRPSKTQEDDGIKYLLLISLYRIDPTSPQIRAALIDIAGHDPNPELRKGAAGLLTGMSTEKGQPSAR